MLGYAVQKGLIPLGLAAIEEAIRLNGVAIDRNILALNLGRALAHDEGFAEEVLKQRRGEIETLSQTLEETIERPHEASHELPEQGPTPSAIYRLSIGSVSPTKLMGERNSG